MPCKHGWTWPNTYPLLKLRQETPPYISLMIPNLKSTPVEWLHFSGTSPNSTPQGYLNPRLSCHQTSCSTGKYESGLDLGLILQLALLQPGLFKGRSHHPKVQKLGETPEKREKKKEKRNIASHEELNYIKLLSLDKRIWMGPQKRTDLVRGKGFCVAALIPFIDKTSLQTLQSYIFSTECLLGCDWDPCVMQARPDFFDPCRLHVWCLYGGGMISSLSMLFQPHVSKAGNPFRERHAMARLA